MSTHPGMTTTSLGGLLKPLKFTCVLKWKAMLTILSELKIGLLKMNLKPKVM